MSAVLTATEEPIVQTDLNLGLDQDPQPRRWTRDEYYRMGEIGYFQDQRVELIEGEILVMSPQSASHSYFVDRVAEILRNSGWPNVWARMQFPIDLGRYSEPEPDVSVVPGNPKDYLLEHPTSALLVVEISRTTLAFDRGRKASLYAMRGIADYWIVNLVDGQLEVRRDPRPDPSQPYGFGYGSTTILRKPDRVSPLAAPGLSFAVEELMG